MELVLAEVKMSVEGNVGKRAVDAVDVEVEMCLQVSCVRVELPGVSSLNK